MVRQHGWRRAMRSLNVLASWGIAVRANGWEPITVEQYQAYWRLSRAQAFRDRQRWREVFVGEEDPNARIIAARSQYEALTAELGQEPSRDEFAAMLALTA